MLDLDNECIGHLVALAKDYKQKVAEYAATYAHQAKKELAVLAKCGRI